MDRTLADRNNGLHDTLMAVIYHNMRTVWCMKMTKGVQTDIFGNPIQDLNVKNSFRVVKCGRCGNTVKASQAKTHLSFGNTLTICNKCLQEMDKDRKRRMANDSMKSAKINKYLET